LEKKFIQNEEVNVDTYHEMHSNVGLRMAQLHLHIRSYHLSEASRFYNKPFLFHRTHILLF